jgi:Uncharacterized alpha/beta hydrolase domain (DUF2235)
MDMTNKRIVLCLDGTWNSPFDEQERDDGSKVLRPSNVLKLARAVIPRPADSCEQLTYYDIGVGSLAKYPGLSNRLLHRADKMLGGGFAAGFEGNVEDALSFLALNYAPGDEVYIFGFSRGAATARAVTRFLDWSGGVPVKGDAYYLPRLFRRYVISRGEPSALQAEIAEINAKGKRLGELVPVTVSYLGVWDTVAALGSLAHMMLANRHNSKRSFHIGSSPVRCVRSARHAIAVDESRLDFPPEIWTGPSDEGQTIEQKWFAGVHSNIGGGYVLDGLANIALHWIIEGAANLKLDDTFLAPFKRMFDGTQFESRTMKYRILETMRMRRNKGVRQVTGWPAAANLELHHTVIDRMRKDAVPYRTGDKSSEVQRPYRPDNVIRYLAEQPDLDVYLARIGSPGPLPSDVMARIATLRQGRAGASPAGGAAVPAAP